MYKILASILAELTPRWMKRNGPDMPEAAPAPKRSRTGDKTLKRTLAPKKVGRPGARPLHDIASNM